MVPMTPQGFGLQTLAPPTATPGGGGGGGGGCGDAGCSTDHSSLAPMEASSEPTRGELTGDSCVTIDVSHYNTDAADTHTSLLAVAQWKEAQAQVQVKQPYVQAESSEADLASAIAHTFSSLCMEVEAEADTPVAGGTPGADGGKDAAAATILHQLRCRLSSSLCS